MVARGSPKAKVEGSSPLVVEIFFIFILPPFMSLIHLDVKFKHRSLVERKKSELFLNMSK